VREPRRSALALLWELDGEQAYANDALPPVAACTPAERTLLARMLAKGLNAPVTSSAGRLFDGIAALLGLRQRAGFEGQAALLLEWAVEVSEQGAYPVAVRATAGALVLDWEPLLRALLDDRSRGVATGVMAARVHRGLAQGIAVVAQCVGLARVALTGGCFQNKVLSEWTAEALRAAGFEVLQHRQVAANDGGLCLGQAAVARTWDVVRQAQLTSYVPRSISEGG
jgi:hydrogenase maturation protein HypF